MAVRPEITDLRHKTARKIEVIIYLTNSYVGLTPRQYKSQFN
jgi:hypothetical protein